MHECWTVNSGLSDATPSTLTGPPDFTFTVRVTVLGPTDTAFGGRRVALPRLIFFGATLRVTGKAATGGPTISQAKTRTNITESRAARLTTRCYIAEHKM